MMELLNNKSILSNELVQKMGIHIANISMLESPNIVKMGNCNFLQPDDLFLPKNIKQFIRVNAGTFTNLENMLPCKFARDELEVSEKHLLDSGIVEKIVEVAGKQFYKFSDNFVIEWRTIGSSIQLIDTAFDFQITGDNYTPGAGRY